MSLEQWKSNGWLKSHRTDAGELANLLAIADRNLADAEAEGLLDFARELRAEVVGRLGAKYPELGKQ